jgi:hypothetical protein
MPVPAHAETVTENFPGFVGDENTGCAPAHSNWEIRMTVQRRRRFKQSRSLEERLAAEAKRLREEARSLPPGAAREVALRKARQAETASHMNAWLASSEAKPPTQP